MCVTARKLERIPKRSLAFTTGKPVSGEPQTIEVKMLIPSFQPLSIPLQNLEAVKPLRAEGAAIVISGEHFGKEVAVLGEAGHSGLWELLILDVENIDSNSYTPVHATASPDHLVISSRPVSMFSSLLSR